MTKREQIIQTIRDYDHSIEWRGDWISRLAGECECSRSTVYRTIAYLKSIDAMNNNNQYTGRVPSVDEINELLAADGGDEVPVLLTSERVIKWCDALLCEVDMFWYLVDGWLRNSFRWIGGAYGRQMMIKDVA